MDPLQRWKNTNYNTSNAIGIPNRSSGGGIRTSSIFGGGTSPLSSSLKTFSFGTTELRQPFGIAKPSGQLPPEHIGNIMTDSMEEYGDNGDKTLFKGVRVSKYRHVYGTVARKDQCYDNIAITKNAHDSNFCAVNLKFLAIVTESCGGGCFIVIPIEKCGRVDNNATRVSGHSAQVFDIKWNPFNDNVIASCSDDTTIKLWYIPDGEELSLNRDLKQPIMDLCGHKRRVNYIEWHPTADNILVSAGADHKLVVWNTATGFAVRTIQCHNDTIYSMSFNRDGSRLATTCKDKKLRIIDPRTAIVIKEHQCHDGTRSSKVVYLGDSGRLFTVGFSRYSERQWAIWSEDDLSAPLTIESIDSSSGLLYPYYDHDTRMVYVAGKGDGNIRYYETTDEAPYCHYLSQFLSGLPQRGLGIMPKRGCDVYKCELFRFYKLHATKSICEPISMIVPRKSEQFQSDVFPDTAAPTPALTADQWLAGQTRNPVLFSLESGAGAKTNKPIFFNPFMSNKSATRFSEQKLNFLLKSSPVDYREKEQQESMMTGEEMAMPPPPEEPIRRDNGTAQSNTSKINKDNSAKPKRMAKKSQSTRFETILQQFQPEIGGGPKKSESALAMNFRDSIGKSAAVANSNARSRLPWIKAVDDGNQADSNDGDNDDDDYEDDEDQRRRHHKHFHRIPNHQPQVRRQTEAAETEQQRQHGVVAKAICDNIISVNNKHLSPAEAKAETDGDDDGYDRDESDEDSANTTDDSIAESFQSSIENSPISDSSLKNCPSISDLIESHLSNSPKNERELWTAFHELRALVHNLHSQLKEKDKRIQELESIFVKKSTDLGNNGNDNESNINVKHYRPMVVVTRKQMAPTKTTATTESP